MKTFLQEILRWAAIVAFGGFGLWMLVSMAHPLITDGSGSGFVVFAVLFTIMVVSLPSFGVAYYCFRREYRKIFLIVGLIGGIAVWGVLLKLPDWLGIYERVMDHKNPHNIWLGILGLPLSLLFLFGPIFAAAWFFRLCQKLAYRGTDKIKTGTKTKATGWLVAVGLCFIVAPMLISLFMFAGAITSPSTPPSLAWVDKMIIDFIMCSPALGAVLMIVGLAWRRPVEVRRAETPTETNKMKIEEDIVGNPATQ
ncbi:MAG: hypothetical protein GX594_12850 [Pirellulaceae bacterium]|nr:hypothetical protein [Pirellulaceae bacterium]